MSSFAIPIFGMTKSDPGIPATPTTASTTAAVRVFHNAAQSIGSGVLTALAFNSERFDTNGMHDTATNNSRLTCQAGGKYQITGNIEWAGNAGGLQSILLIRLNGSAFIGYFTAVGADVRVMSVTTLYDLAVNDYVELMVEQFTGGALNVNSTGNYSPEFMMAKVA